MDTKNETIEDIAAELRLLFSEGRLAIYFRNLADRIEAAHAEGVVRALNELMQP